MKVRELRGIGRLTENLSWSVSTPSCQIWIRKGKELLGMTNREPLEARQFAQWQRPQYAGNDERGRAILIVPQLQVPRIVSSSCLGWVLVIFK